MAEIKWITDDKGNHIPIKSGQSKKEALDSFYTRAEKLKALERKYEDDPKAFADSLKREITEPKYIEKKVEAVVKVSPAEYRIIQSQVMDKVAARKAKGKRTKFNTYIRTANNSYKVKINGFNFKIITKYDIEKDYYILNAWSIDDD